MKLTPRQEIEMGRIRREQGLLYAKQIPDNAAVRVKLDKWCKKLSRLSANRRDALESAASEFGRHSSLTDEEITERLFEACIENGLVSTDGEDVTRKAIKAEIAKGRKNPHPDLKLLPTPQNQSLPTSNGAIQTLSIAASLSPVWRELKRDKTPSASFHNAKIGIVAMNFTVRHDLFHDVTIIVRAGTEETHDIRPLVGELSDPALVRLRDMFSQTYGFDVGEKNIFAAVQALAFDNCFDPVLDLIDTAQRLWEQDKVPRLERLAPDYLNIEDTELNRAVIRKHMIAAVRRARKPGCQYQMMPVLESVEGWNKSGAISTIAGKENFSDENILATRGKEAMELLKTIWHHENPELAGIRKAEVEHVKSYISRQFDMHRPAYGHVLVKQPRRSVEWGTTNDSEYLPSQTGNRRFAPMKVLRPIDLEKLSRDRLLLIGEAAHYEALGEGIVIDESLWPLASVEQEKCRTRDPWEDMLANIPDTAILNDATRHAIIHKTADRRELVASADILTHVLKISPAQQNSGHGRRMATAMMRNGWLRHESGLVEINEKPSRGYWRYAEPGTDKA